MTYKTILLSMLLSIAVRLLTFMLVSDHVLTLDNGLAQTPPMGWMQWERFRCVTNCTADPDNCIGENLFKQIADRMVEDGYKDAGYEYVSIDDCWLLPNRGPDGRLTPDPERFPSGMKALADYVHSKGLKLGIYADMGLFTCKKYPGSKFFLQLDAQTFASWGVDMLKLDCCYAGSLTDLQTGYQVMGFYLNQTQRSVLYSCSWPACARPQVFGATSDSLTLGLPMSVRGIKILPREPFVYFFCYPVMTMYLNQTKRPVLYACSWPACEGLYYKHQPDYKLIAKHCNMWRNYNDLRDSWEYVYAAIDYYGNNSANFQQIAGPGGWNDPDQLVVGDFGLSYDQERAQFGMWCMMASPLFMSVDLRNIRKSSKELLLNKNLLRIHQDELGVQAYRISKGDGLEVWLKPLHGQFFIKGSYAIAVLQYYNYGGPLKFSSRLVDLGLNNTQGYSIMELFNGTDMGKLVPKQKLEFLVDPTGIYIVTAIPK